MEGNGVKMRLLDSTIIKGTTDLLAKHIGLRQISRAAVCVTVYLVNFDKDIPYMYMNWLPLAVARETGHP